MHCSGKHVIISDIAEDFRDHPYLSKQGILNFPKCLFSASKVCHETDLNGIYAILDDGGFRSGNDKYLWFNILTSADDCIKTDPTVLPGETFINSPTFQSKSFYGNFRFTFDLKDVLNMYSKGHCNRTAPVLRVMETRLFKKEIVYCVLVHPPHMTHYRKYPRLPFDNAKLCGYSQKKMSWNCQSPSDKYEYTQEVDNEGGEVGDVRPLQRSEYYVYDRVSVAFHIKRNRVLRISRKRLLNCLSVCGMASNKPEMSVDEAEEQIEKLKKMYL